MYILFKSYYIVYWQLTVLERFYTMLQEGKNGEDVPAELRPVLTRICSLFGLWRLEQHLTTLYQGNKYVYVLKSNKMNCVGVKVKLK